MQDLPLSELKEFLDEKVWQYNRIDFIETDPIQIPHAFTLKEDIEISAFLMAILAWGNRKIIINKGRELMAYMGNSPYDFVINHQDSDLEKITQFKHRTFNAEDMVYFIQALKQIYLQNDGLEKVFEIAPNELDTHAAIDRFRTIFLSYGALNRTAKHISSPAKGSAAKRINMFLRWMIRRDQQGVDFGLWSPHNMPKLMCPLDVHSGKIARKLGLLDRKQDDKKALDELMFNLRRLDEKDPVKYDFALFGLGAFEGF